MQSSMFEKIKNNIRRRMNTYTDSRQLTSDEIRLAWLVTEVDRLKRIKVNTNITITEKFIKTNILVKKDGTWLKVDILNGRSFCHRLETFAEKAQSYLLSEMCKEIRNIIISHMENLTKTQR